MKIKIKGIEKKSKIRFTHHKNKRKAKIIGDSINLEDMIVPKKSESTEYTISKEELKDMAKGQEESKLLGALEKFEKAIQGEKGISK